ncbi:NUDIX hydrolase [Christensenellaceae bacterium OttesenSCG-928-L17]|nr:NUDIX hydrolase [Christensenellaceae bacterium OttesenSCG-928-L17]
MRGNTNEQGQTLREFLAAYDETKYRRPSVTVDVAVFTYFADKLHVLLVRRKNHPFIGQWALPGGFVEFDEEIAAAAQRELFEETGVSGVPLAEVGVFGAPGRDPRTRVVSVAHVACAPRASFSVRAGDDAAEAALFSIALNAQSPGVCALRLRGPRTIHAQAGYKTTALKEECFALPVQDPFAPEVLAADHAHMLVSCFLALLARPPGAAAKLLAGNNDALCLQAEAWLKQAREKLAPVF